MQNWTVAPSTITKTTIYLNHSLTDRIEGSSEGVIQYYVHPWGSCKFAVPPRPRQTRWARNTIPAVFTIDLFQEVLEDFGSCVVATGCTQSGTVTNTE